MLFPGIYFFCQDKELVYTMVQSMSLRLRVNCFDYTVSCRANMDQGGIKHMSSNKKLFLIFVCLLITLCSFLFMLKIKGNSLK
jgi:hypothetical protein